MSSTAQERTQLRRQEEAQEGQEALQEAGQVLLLRPQSIDGAAVAAVVAAVHLPARMRFNVSQPEQSTSKYCVQSASTRNIVGRYIAR